MAVMVSGTRGVRSRSRRGGSEDGRPTGEWSTSRRDLIRSGILAWAGSGGLRLAPGPVGAPAVAPGAGPGSDPSLIVRSPRPLNLESPIEALDQRLTPN